MDLKINFNLLIIYACVLVEYLAMGLIVSLLPFYAGNANQMVYSILCISLPVGQILCMVPMGFLSDKYGRKIALLLSLFGCCSGFVLQSLSKSLITLIIYRLSPDYLLLQLCQVKLILLIV